MSEQRGNNERTPRKEVISTANNRSLRPFNTLPPEERRELARKGGIASGEKRRDRADAVHNVRLYLAAQDLIEETREEYRRAIKRYVREEQRRNKKKLP